MSSPSSQPRVPPWKTRWHSPGKSAQALSKPTRIQGQLIQIPPCVGFVTGQGRDWGSSEYLRFADAAMYKAKREEHTSICVFDETLESYLAAQQSMAEELAQALQRGELDVLYQTIVQLDTRRVVGLEALVCWNHPRRGLAARRDVHPDGRRDRSDQRHRRVRLRARMPDVGEVAQEIRGQDALDQRELGTRSAHPRRLRGDGQVDPGSPWRTSGQDSF